MHYNDRTGCDHRRGRPTGARRDGGEGLHPSTSTTGLSHRNPGHNGVWRCPGHDGPTWEFVCGDHRCPRVEDGQLKAGDRVCLRAVRWSTGGGGSRRREMLGRCAARSDDSAATRVRSRLRDRRPARWRKPASHQAGDAPASGNRDVRRRDRISCRIRRWCWNWSCASASTRGRNDGPRRLDGVSPDAGHRSLQINMTKGPPARTLAGAVDEARRRALRLVTSRCPRVRAMALSGRSETGWARTGNCSRCPPTPLVSST